MARTSRSVRKAASSGLAYRESNSSKRPLVDPSSSLLEMHLEEIGEECRNITGYLRILKRSTRRSEEAEDAEAQLYAALTHLEHHAGPAVREWDKVIDRMDDRPRRRGAASRRKAAA